MSMISIISESIKDGVMIGVLYVIYIIFVRLIIDILWGAGNTLIVILNRRIFRTMVFNTTRNKMKKKYLLITSHISVIMYTSNKLSLNYCDYLSKHHLKRHRFTRFLYGLVVRAVPQASERLGVLEYS